MWTTAGTVILNKKIYTHSNENYIKNLSIDMCLCVFLQLLKINPLNAEIEKDSCVFQIFIYTEGIDGKSAEVNLLFIVKKTHAYVNPTIIL